jgi:hypothetical protein
MSRTAGSARTARHPAVNWVLGGTQLVTLLCGVAYFVPVQVNAAAFLSGYPHTIIPGSTPPAALDSDGAAIADVLGGLLIEAVAAVVFYIAIRFALYRHRPEPGGNSGAARHGLYIAASSFRTATAWSSSASP